LRTVPISRPHFRAGLGQLQSDKSGRPYLILVSDGNATLGKITTKEILDEVAQLRQSQAAGMAVRLCTFGIGGDANRTLLAELASNNSGFSTWVRDSEDIEYALTSFNSRLAAIPLQGLQLDISPSESVSMIYPVESGLAFPGSVRQWLGRLAPGASALQANATADYGDARANWQFAGRVRAAETHDFLPRAWAKARVDALLRQIELEGETSAAIEEIIRLAKRYHFVTPYTSFLAAPRALLRPRLIQPGDPLLRIRTDEDIESVTAIFPFGLVKPMSYPRFGKGLANQVSGASFDERWPL